jgi:hypothetical protein
MAGMWKQHQLWDGTYDLDDLLDAHEILEIQNENTLRAEEAARQRRE